MKIAKYLLSILALFAFLAAPVPAQETEGDLEEALKKLDEYYKKLRKDLEEKLRQKRDGQKEPGEAAEKPFLGLSLSPITKGVRVLLNLEADEGVAVKKVVDGSPAEAAGLRLHDIILSVNGRKIGSVEGMQEMLGGVKAGGTLQLRILRDGSRMDVPLTMGARAGGKADKPSKAEREIDKFMEQTLKNRREAIAGYLKDLLGEDMEKRLRARRFFERIATQSKENREKIVKEIEKAAEELVAGMSEADKAELRKVFDDLLGGLKDKFRKPSGTKSQRIEDIEKYLDDLLSGKKKDGARPGEDDVDKLIEDLLGDKKGKEGDKDGLDLDIPKEFEDMLRGFLGKEGWERVKAMLKDPGMRDMVKQYLPKDYKFTPEWIRKLMAQFGVTEEELPDKLKEMGLDDETIRKITDLLKKNPPPPADVPKDGKPWIGVRVGDIGKEQLEKLGVSGGIVVTGVTAGGPAEKAGLLVNDVVLKADSAEIKSADDLKTALGGARIGAEIRFTVLRDGYKKVITVTVAARK